MTTNPFILINDSSDSDTAPSLATWPIPNWPSWTWHQQGGNVSFHTGLAREGLISLGALEDDSLWIRKPNVSQGWVCLPSATPLSHWRPLNVELWQLQKRRCHAASSACCVKCELIDLLFRLH